MSRILAKWWAKTQYLFSLEAEAHRNTINAAIASRNAAEKRKLVAQLNDEAEAIESNVAKVEADEEARLTAGDLTVVAPFLKRRNPQGKRVSRATRREHVLGLAFTRAMSKYEG